MKENDKIRIYRALHGLEQTELARAMGANRPAVAKWEKGVYLPQPDEMSRLGIYNWIRAGSRLDPQFFSPILPDQLTRPQSINHYLKSIRELFVDFCNSEMICGQDIIVYRFSDGDLVKLGDHCLLSMGAFRSTLDGLLVGGYQPASIKEWSNPKDRLTEIVKDEDRCRSVLSACNFSASKMHFLKIQDVLWQGIAIIEVSVKTAKLSPSHIPEVEQMIQDVLQKALTDRFKTETPTPTFAVDIVKSS